MWTTTRRRAIRERQNPLQDGRLGHDWHLPALLPQLSVREVRNGPYLASIDDNGQPQYSATPVVLAEPDDEDDQWGTSEDGYPMRD